MNVREPTEVVRSWTTDSRRWANFKPRDGDIVICTSAKCGTTWMQQIVSLLVFQSPEPRSVQEPSPWLDMRVPPLEAMLANLEGQTHRRFIKSHVQLEALPVYDALRYIHVARDGRDAFMSWHNHSFNYSDMAVASQSAAGMADETIGKPLPRPSESIRDYFDVWMTEGEGARLADDFPASRYFAIERSYWAARRTMPNLLMVHYADLKADLNGQMRRIAAFLGMDIPEVVWPSLIEAASFDSMRKNGATLMPRAAMGWDKGHERFLNKGTNGRWRDELSAEQIARYETRAARELSPSLAKWLANGSLAAGDPLQMAD
jgi:aryl sulfotransferase